MIGRSERLALRSSTSDKFLCPRRTTICGSLALSAWTLAVLVMAVGCRDSVKTSAPSSVSAQASSSRAQEAASVAPKGAQSTNAVAKTPIPTHEPPPPPMDAMVPIKTFEIQPPATFASDQLLQDGGVEFHFSGSAGRILRVRSEQLYRVRVQPPGGGSALKPGWDSTGNWFFGLPKTGMYFVLYAPWKRTPGIQFDFLPDDDPRSGPRYQAGRSLC